MLAKDLSTPWCLLVEFVWVNQPFFVLSSFFCHCIVCASIYIRLKMKPNSVRIRFVCCQIFAHPSTGFELTPLIHCRHQSLSFMSSAIYIYFSFHYLNIVTLSHRCFTINNVNRIMRVLWIVHQNETSLICFQSYKSNIALHSRSVVHSTCIFYLRFS